MFFAPRFLGRAPPPKKKIFLGGGIDKSTPLPSSDYMPRLVEIPWLVLNFTYADDIKKKINYLYSGKI